MSADTTPARSRQPHVGVSRRTLVAGTAWAVPAVVVATAAPAVAASTPVNLSGCTFTFDTSGSCRSKNLFGGGYSGYLIRVIITKSATCTSTVDLAVNVNGAIAIRRRRSPSMTESSRT